MTQYKGLYIDNVVFNSKEDIDNFLKEQAIRSYRIAVQAFCEHCDMEHSLYADEQAERLNAQFGMDWEEIEAIEIEAMQAA